MAGTKLRLGRSDVAAVIDEKHAAERDGWRKTRLLAVKLAARGDHTSAEVADICGIARGHLFRWLAAVREGGLEALLKRDKPGPREGTPRDVDAAVFKELQSKLKAGDFVTAEQARQWLEEKHGVVRPYATVWRWLKKAGGVLLVPRPSHSKKDPAAAQAFREGLAEQLERLEIPQGSKVKLWMMETKPASGCTPRSDGCGPARDSAPWWPVRSNTNGTIFMVRSMWWEGRPTSARFRRSIRNGTAAIWKTSP
jgi:transposase